MDIQPVQGSLSTLLDQTKGLPSLLKANPNITNVALAAVVEANLPNFHGSVSVERGLHVYPSSEEAKSSKIIYMTPYSRFQDRLVSFQRFFTGVEFEELDTEDPLENLEKGRRLTIYIAEDLLSIEYTFEQPYQACSIL